MSRRKVRDCLFTTVATNPLICLTDTQPPARANALIVRGVETPAAEILCVRVCHTVVIKTIKKKLCSELIFLAVLVSEITHGCTGFNTYRCSPSLCACLF